VGTRRGRWGRIGTVEAWDALRLREPVGEGDWVRAEILGPLAYDA
jgi:hypothetical protein